MGTGESVGRANSPTLDGVIKEGLSQDLLFQPRLQVTRASQADRVIVQRSPEAGRPRPPLAQKEPRRSQSRSRGQQGLDYIWSLGSESLRGEDSLSGWVAGARLRSRSAFLCDLGKEPPRCGPSSTTGLRALRFERLL